MRLRNLLKLALVALIPYGLMALLTLAPHAHGEGQRMFEQAVIAAAEHVGDCALCLWQSTASGCVAPIQLASPVFPSADQCAGTDRILSAASGHAPVALRGPPNFAVPSVILIPA